MKETKKQKKIHSVMKEFKDGTLKSSNGKKVTNRKQAIAIALSYGKHGWEKAAHIHALQQGYMAKESFHKLTDNNSKGYTINNQATQLNQTGTLKNNTDVTTLGSQFKSNKFTKGIAGSAELIPKTADPTQLAKNVTTGEQAPLKLPDITDLNTNVADTGLTGLGSVQKNMQGIKPVTNNIKPITNTPKPLGGHNMTKLSAIQGYTDAGLRDKSKESLDNEVDYARAMEDVHNAKSFPVQHDSLTQFLGGLGGAGLGGVAGYELGKYVGKNVPYKSSLATISGRIGVGLGAALGLALSRAIVRSRANDVLNLTNNKGAKGNSKKLLADIDLLTKRIPVLKDVVKKDPRQQRYMKTLRNVLKG